MQAYEAEQQRSALRLADLRAARKAELEAQATAHAAMLEEQVGNVCGSTALLLEAMVSA